MEYETSARQENKRIGQTIRQERKLRGWTLQQLAEQADSDTGTLSKVERGVQGASRHLLGRIAKAMGVDIAQLFRAADSPGGGFLIAEPIAGMPKARVVEVREWTSPEVSATPKKWVSCPAVKPGPNTFAVVLEGESMVSPYPGHQSFFPGTTLFVDPGREASPGSFVLAVTESGKTTFKKLVEDAGEFILAPSNPQFPTIKAEGTKILGRVIAAYMEV